MPITQPYYRTCRQFTDGHYAHGNKGRYVEDTRFAKDGEHYVRALALIQKDLLDLFDFIEPDHQNKDAYSYRTHALHMRTAIEVEANFRAILEENGYVKRDKNGAALDPSDWNMRDFKRLERTHLLSHYEIMLPVWKGPADTRVRKPFAQWASGNALPWWDAYNAAKHDRHEKFAEANFANLIDAVCALVAILSAQFFRHDFSPGPVLLALEEGGAPAGYETAIGGYFWVRFPSWPAGEQYDFQWDPQNPGTFQRHQF
jgi:hypothetical protein